MKIRQVIVQLRMEVGMGEQLKREVYTSRYAKKKMNKHNIGQKRKRKDCDGSDELSIILAKFIEVTKECDTKRRLVEAELEEKQREQKQKHGEDDDHDDGFYAKDGGVPSCSLSAPHSNITIFYGTILSLHTGSRFPTFQPFFTLLS